MEYLFPDFLDDARQYREAQAFWAVLCEQVLAKHYQLDLWRTWFKEIELDDGSILQHGNPIHSLVNLKESKGVTIIQQDPKVHTKWEMTAFVNLFGDEHDESGSVNNLVFTCNLTQKSAGTFERLFETWIQPECTVQGIEQTIRNLRIG